MDPYTLETAEYWALNPHHFHRNQHAMPSTLHTSGAPGLQYQQELVLSYEFETIKNDHHSAAIQFFVFIIPNNDM